MDERAESLEVGLVGDGEAVAGAIAGAAAAPVRGDPATVLAADPDVVVAVGEDALLALARAGPEPPVLPVAAGAGVRSVPRTRVEAAIAAVAAGDHRTARHPLLAVETGEGEAAHALFDAALVAAEPARISAFTVEAAGEGHGSIRADGLVVATPAGTRGYTRALRAPTVRPGSDVLAVEPIGQFATRPDRWVVPLAPVTVTVARDEVPVEVVVDGRVVAEASQGESVTIAPDGSIDTVVVQASQSRSAE
jgi:NAD+ kinase